MSKHIRLTTTLAVAAALSAFAATTASDSATAVANGPTAPDYVGVVANDPGAMISILEVHADPSLAYQPVDIIQGSAPGTGAHMGTIALEPGATMFPVSTVPGEWTTLVGATFTVSTNGWDDIPLEQE